MSRLRIASYYENRLGRNDGNPLYMWHAFGKFGDIESGHLIPYGDLNKWGKWDLHWESDWGEDALEGLLPYETDPIPHPNAFWASDTHLGYEWRLQKSKEVDFSFCCQKRAVEEFKRDGVKNPMWMPHAVEPLAYPHIPSIKKNDVCFIGHINDDKRIDVLDRLFREFPDFFMGQRLFEEAAEVYCQSKICFNHSVKDDINMRTFEVMATKSFLLTTWVPTLHELFEDGKHLVTYKTMDEAVEKAKYYIKHTKEREKIAEAGQKEVLAKHTFRHRCEQVLKATGLSEKLKELVTV